MHSFIQNYLGTIIVAAILAAAIIFVIVRLIKNKKAGKSSCGCEGCPQQPYCHRKDGCGRYGHKQ
ncbi:MAG: FeoB-associated Cys-rich membrane protein [Clostridia bacterium]|nr:FeoB-associated Cys-rich membrane protein [Clostridia bacterium]